MFNKPIFLQSVRQFRWIWLTITLLSSIILCLLIGIYSEKFSDLMLGFLQGTALGDLVGESASSYSSLIGQLGTIFYRLIVPVLALVFTIIVANSMVAGEVDKGSLAYTLSTPVKRTSVIFTKAMFLISSLFVMFLILTVLGLFTSQIAHGAIWGKGYTADVKEVAKVLDMDRADVANDLTVILKNDAAVKAGAKARKMDTDTYKIYLGMAIDVQNGKELATLDLSPDMQERIAKAVSAAAEVLGMSPSEVTDDIGLIKSNQSALSAAASAAGISRTVLTAAINQTIAYAAAISDAGIEFDIGLYLLMNLGCFFLMLMSSGISFFASCLFNLSKNSLALGAGLPLFFYIMNLLWPFDRALDFFKYLTLFSLYRPLGVAAGVDATLIAGYIIMPIVGLALYAAGIVVFKKKDLPL